MSEIIDVPVRSVNTITTEILSIAKQAAQILFLSACEMGKRMLEAKELCAHGEWGEYLTGLCGQLGISSSTAHNWMQLYKQYGDSLNLQTFGNLSYSKAVKLLSLPEETREEFLQENDVESMSARELEHAIREAKAAQDQLAAAKVTTADLEYRLDAQTKKADGLKQELDKATAAASDAKAQLQQLRENPEIPADKLGEIANEALRQARKEMDEKLRQAQAETADKEEARQGMENALVEAQRQITELKSLSQLGSQDAISFKILYDQVVSTFNQMMGYLLRVEATDPELGVKFRYAARRMGEKFTAYAERKEKNE